MNNLHTHLRTFGGDTAEELFELLSELRQFHPSFPTEGLPESLEQMQAGLAELERSGLAWCDAGKWRALEVAKREPQMELFSA